MRNCLLIAGEKSGEEHAMSFFPELRRLCPDVKFFGVGGDQLEAQGMECLYHLKDFSSMGFSEVIQKIPFYIKALKKLETEVVTRGATTAILVDFQDFNLRLARKLSARGVRVLYYVAPQAWAWKAQRAEVLAKVTHTLFTILPFEKSWFKTRGVSQVKAIPHPLMLTYKNEHPPERPFGHWGDKIKVLLLPGSRRFEVELLLPQFIQATKLLKNVEVHLVKVDHIPASLYELHSRDVDVWYDSKDLTKAMSTCHVALAASGTVTLSTAMFELPTIVAYRGSLLNEFIYNNLVKYQGPISLTNIIHGQMLFPEFIQGFVNAPAMARIINTWTHDEKIYNQLKARLKETRKLLSGEDFSVPEYMARVIHE
jgi:lipid-A-disaccharide synthase